ANAALRSDENGARIESGTVFAFPTRESTPARAYPDGQVVRGSGGTHRCRTRNGSCKSGTLGHGSRDCRPTRSAHVKNPFSSNDLPDSIKRRIELAVAVAQERLLATHVRHALDLIQIVGDQVPFENALAIYTRLLRLSEDESRVITTRALATLGEQAGEGEIWPELSAEPAEQREPRRSFMNLMRSRLRGRVNDDLRRQVELASARTEVAILNTHVENALQFVELLENELPYIEAVEMYLDALQVRDSIAEVTAYMALARLADEHLPTPATPVEAPQIQAVPQRR